MSKDSPRTSVLRDNDLIQKGQDDLIRRGDALKALDWGDIYGRNAQDAINAIPAASATQHDFAQPTVSPELLATTNDVQALLNAAERVINSYWHSTDGVITGIYDLEAALARVKSKEGFSNEKGVM